jgi:putative ABC transport system ATP-binding protein
MNKSIARYIWNHTRGQQLWILLVVLVSMIPYYMSFDLPKLIVNGPIQGQGFDAEGATKTYFPISFNIPGLGHFDVFSGIELQRLSSLMFLSGIFLLLVIINGGFKFYINTYKGRLGERMLRRIRFELVDRVLRFPPVQFKRLKPSEIATMVKDEVEPLGGFIGDAFVQPALLGGQALTAMVFIMVQDWWLGSIALAIVAIQLVIIPRMRKRLIILGRERQLTARELSGRIGEISEGIAAIHTHDTSNYERADISARLGRIFKIRYDLYQWKFLVKFLNNFLAQVTPFLFYAIGGYQVIKGNLDVGQLVAVIAAYKDLPSPLKDLIDWDQTRQDVAVKYAQVYEQFDIEGMIDPDIQSLDVNTPAPLKHPIAALNLSLTDDSGAKLLERTSISISPGEHVAIVGTTGGGGEAFAEALAGLIWPESGKVTIGSQDILTLPESVTGRRIAYAGSDAFLFQGSLGDNLLYGLRHAPLRPPEHSAEMAIGRAWHVDEARKSGNSEFDFDSDWIDYESVGATGPESLFAAILPVLNTVLLSDDIFDLGLRSTTSQSRHPDVVNRIVDVRKAFRKRLESENLGGLVVPFESSTYNVEATVSENLLFGAATGASLADGALAANPYILSVLKESGLEEPLLAMGIEIASNVVELFRDLPPSHPFFQQLNFMTAEEIPDYQALLARFQSRGLTAVSAKDRSRVIALSFTYIEPRQRFGILTPDLMAQIVTARATFRQSLPVDLASRIEPYDAEQFNTAASLMDNVLLGRVGHQHADAAKKIRTMVRTTLQELGLYSDLISIGLEFNAGVGGKRLTAGQRQRLNLARALLKRPDFLILNRPLSALDLQTQKQIMTNVFERTKQADPKPAVIWVVASPTLSNMFDRIIVFDRGMQVGDGTYETLVTGNSIFKGLLT